jgi:hypothetical protein
MTRLLQFSIPSERLIVTGLILLLGIQLTGLSCINDWKSGSSSSALSLISADDRSLDGTSAIPDKPGDGCPCHLVFQSVPFSTWQPTSLLTSADTPSPATYTPTFVQSLFHPPVIL